MRIEVKGNMRRVREKVDGVMVTVETTWLEEPTGRSVSHPKTPVPKLPEHEGLAPQFFAAKDS